MNLRRKAAELDGYTFRQTGYGWWVGHTNRQESGPKGTEREAVALAPDYTGNSTEAIAFARRQGHRVEFFGASGVMLDDIELDTSKDSRAVAVVRAIVDREGPSLEDMYNLIHDMSAAKAINAVSELTEESYKELLIRLRDESKFKTVRHAASLGLAKLESENERQEQRCKAAADKLKGADVQEG